MRICIPVCATRKLFLYSVHDTTLMPCLMALGVFDMRWPPYAADITLELYQHRHNKQHYVKISYIGQVRPVTYSVGPQGCNALLRILNPFSCALKDQKIPGCSDVYCPLREFKQALTMYALPEESYHTLCNRRADIPTH